MQAIVPPDSHHLSAAIGWMELGNDTEAGIELAQISPPLRSHPDVLETEYALHAHRQDWPAALACAQALLKAAPGRASGWLHQAYALRRVPGCGLPAAWDALLPAAGKFPEAATIHFNLACYACQMRQIDEAWTWLKRAMLVGGRKEILTLALADGDLEPLWPEIRRQNTGGGFSKK